MATAKKIPVSVRDIVRSRGYGVSVTPLTKEKDRWRARYTPPGADKPITPGRSFLTEDEAWKWVLEEIEKRQNGSWVQGDKRSTTVDLFVENIYWDAKAAMNVDPQTVANDRSRWKNYLKPVWGHWTAAELEDGQEAVTKWRANLPKTTKIRGEGTIGDSQRNQIYWLMHQIVDVMLEHRFLNRSPFPKKSGLKRPEVKKPERILDHDEVSRLAEGAVQFTVGNAMLPIGPKGEFVRKCRTTAQGNRVLVYTLAYGGFRISESLGLRVRDVDARMNEDGTLADEGHELTVDGSQEIIEGAVGYTHKVKTKRSKRRVPIPAFVMKMMVDYITEEIGWDDPDMVLFPTRSDYWRDDVFHKAWPAAKLAALKPHDLRHTAATTWWEAQYSIEEIARFLGDTIATADDVYTAFLRGRKQGKRMTELNRAIERAAKKTVGAETKARRTRRKPPSTPSNGVPIR